MGEKFYHTSGDLYPENQCFLCPFSPVSEGRKYRGAENNGNLNSITKLDISSTSLKCNFSKDLTSKIQDFPTRPPRDFRGRGAKEEDEALCEQSEQKKFMVYNFTIEDYSWFILRGPSHLDEFCAMRPLGP